MYNSCYSIKQELHADTAYMSAGLSESIAEQ